MFSPIFCIKLKNFLWGAQSGLEDGGHAAAG